MSVLGPGPATDIDPGIPLRDLRDEIFMQDGYDPLLEEPEEEEVIEVPAYLEPVPKPEPNDHQRTIMVLACGMIVFAWIMIAPAVGVIFAIVLGILLLARRKGTA